MAEKKWSAEFRRDVQKALAKALGMRCNFDSLATGLDQLRIATEQFEEAAKHAKDNRDVLGVLEGLSATSNLIAPTEPEPGKKLGQMFGAAYGDLMK